MASEQDAASAPPQGLPQAGSIPASQAGMQISAEAVSASIAEAPAAASRARSRSRSPRCKDNAHMVLHGLRSYVVNLDRRPDRWQRVDAMLEKELPWLEYERFSASDGKQTVIPESEVALKWNTRHNAMYGDYDEWVFDAPGTDKDGVHWMWPDDWKRDSSLTFEEDGDSEGATATVTKGDGNEKIIFKVRKAFAQRFLDPGLEQQLSGGERGCAHSHRRLWEIAAGRERPTLILEDDANICFERTGGNGTFNGRIFTERLISAMEEVPDFEVLYLGWSGFRGGNYKHRDEEDTGVVVKKVEYVWTTVAYVLSQAGAKKLLAVACPINQPVDNFMAWEASQGRLKSYVVLDVGDEDHEWAGGIVDQMDFQGDTDVPKSDGGLQGHNYADFAVASEVKGAAGA